MKEPGSRPARPGRRAPGLATQGLPACGETMKPQSLDGKSCEGNNCLRIARSGGDPRLAAEGQLLCDVCRRRLAAEIRELARLYEACEAALSGGTAGGGVRERITGGLSLGLTLNSRAAEARSEILAVLGSWSGLAAQELRVPPPVRRAAALAEFLLLNLTWLASHPAVRRSQQGGGADCRDRAPRCLPRRRQARRGRPLRDARLPGRTRGNRAGQRSW